MTAMVYVLEDDAHVREGLCAMLQGHGYDVVGFSSPAGFLETYTPSTRPSCLVVDLGLPGMNGLDVLETLRRHAIELPFVVVSGILTIRLTVDCMRAGAVTALEKPVQPEALLAAVAEALVVSERKMAQGRTRLTVKDRLATLSEGERQVLEMVLDGTANKVIAADLGVSMRTVESRRAKIMKTFGVKSVAELVRLLTTTAQAN